MSGVQPGWVDRARPSHPSRSEDGSAGPGPCPNFRQNAFPCSLSACDTSASRGFDPRRPASPVPPRLGSLSSGPERMPLRPDTQARHGPASVHPTTRALRETDQPEHLRRTTLLKSSQPRTPTPPAAGGATATRPVRSSARRSATPPVAPDERSELQVSWVGVSSVSRPRHYSRTSRHPPGSFEDTRRRSSSLSRYFARCRSDSACGRNSSGVSRLSASTPSSFRLRSIGPSAAA